MRKHDILLAVVAMAAVLAAPSLASAQTLGLVAYWPLNETSGTTAYDASGNGHNATPVTADGADNCVPPTSAHRTVRLRLAILRHAEQRQRPGGHERDGLGRRAGQLERQF